MKTIDGLERLNKLLEIAHRTDPRWKDEYIKEAKAIAENLLWQYPQTIKTKGAS